MIKIENIKTYGWEAAIRGMRNPLNSWSRSDSFFCKTPDEKCSICESIHIDDCFEGYVLGNEDLDLMKRLVKSGNDHSKFMRMITITMDITAPLYWWKEFDTYKVGTVANSCSTMHKIHSDYFTLDNFSHDHLLPGGVLLLQEIIEELNEAVDAYNHFDEYKEQKLINPSINDRKTVWWKIIQLLPSSYNQKRTVQLNYAVARNMYHARKNHKLDEWKNFCGVLETLPHSELITK